MNGYIHSIESCGTVDGPGLRYIIFTQGCLLRCQFCHNPDTWEIGKGREVTVSEIIKDLKTYLPFIKASKGGITVSGGEPLLQLDFLLALFKECKKLGIHTTIDTSGGCYSNDPSFQEKLAKVLQYTDLLLLDIKQINSKKHIKLTGKPNEHILEFAKYLSDRKIPVWIRHVLVPGITDNKEDLQNLRAFIDTLENVEKVEILPYHKLGVYKWQTLGLKYPLEHVEPPTEDVVQMATSILID
ncbi:pyruvate formate-lyase-activating protein [Litchfieldia alkalitelluris]|uniref:pyruvate formate-lyase-activating protein n=1 Tax=Litchfieldia alkalitelluris TaxID=304268 RepID=UPI000997E324|nr:pyruvate formate-lyase-activating protein [Litchfieldia alkalitelluris]